MEQGLNYFNFQIENYKGADQAAQMCRLVCPFVAGMQQSQVFLCPSPFKIGEFKPKQWKKSSVLSLHFLHLSLLNLKGIGSS